LSGKPENVGDFGYCQGNVRDFDKNQGSVREFHNVWKVGTLILTFAHIVLVIPVFMLDYMTLTLIKYFVMSLKFFLFKRLRLLNTVKNTNSSVVNCQGYVREFHNVWKVGNS
jgi:hypothetical protein